MLFLTVYGRDNNTVGTELMGPGYWLGSKNKGETIFIKRVQEHDSKTTIYLITKHILAGSIVHTDGWKSYLRIHNIETKNYQHL